MLYDDKKFIGSVIKNARKKANLSQAELAELINMCDKNLGNIENGKQFPQVNNFLKIIETLRISLEDFGVKEYKNKSDTNKEELLKIIYSATQQKTQIYLEALNFINKISNS